MEHIFGPLVPLLNREGKKKKRSNFPNCFLKMLLIISKAVVKTIGKIPVKTEKFQLM